jgi:hypothetical protein
MTILLKNGDGLQVPENATCMQAAMAISEEKWTSATRGTFIPFSRKMMRICLSDST